MSRNWLGTYILDEDDKPIPETDTLKWAEWFGSYERHVAETRLGNVHVSTVFLGIDHNFYPMDDPLMYKPVLWETMVFGGSLNEYQRRYDSKEAAQAGHDDIVKQIREEAEKLNAIPMSERAKHRPSDYATLSPEEQWEIDKRLGILDWDGKTNLELAATLVRARLFRDED